MSHSYLVIKTDWIPEWTKTNVPTYSNARFNKDGTKLLLDNAHPISTFLKWVGNTEEAEEQLQFMLLNSDCISSEELYSLSNNPESEWYNVVNE